MAKAWKRAEALGREAAGKLKEMLPERSSPEEDAPLFPALHWMTAGLFLVAGAQMLGRDRGPGALRDPLRMAPLIVAPLAGAAHAARALTSEPRTRLAAQILDGVAAGVAVAGLAQAAYNSAASPAAAGEGRKRWTPRGSTRTLVRAAGPLAFCATALLGLLLEHEEEREREQVRRLERRARVVERLVPKRRPRLDHIVLHI